MMKPHQHPIDLSQRLFIELGTALLIETGNKALSGKLIGMKVGAYLIVDISGVDPDTINLPKEEKVQVRYVNQDDIFRFPSQILMTLEQPDKLIFLHYPEKAESCNVRRHRRVDCFMQIHVRCAERRDPAVITNISANGCLCNMERIPSWGNIIGQQIGICFLYGDQEELVVQGEVKSTRIKGQRINLGVRFIEMDGYSQSVLSTLVPAIRF